MASTKPRAAATALSSSSLGRRKAHTSGSSTQMQRAQRALHHMRGQFSQQTGKHCRAVPFAGPQTGQTARRCTAQEHRTQEQEHRCPHQIVKKTENMLFVHTSSPFGKVIEQHIPGFIFLEQQTDFSLPR